MGYVLCILIGAALQFVDTPLRHCIIRRRKRDSTRISALRQNMWLAQRRSSLGEPVRRLRDRSDGGETKVIKLDIGLDPPGADTNRPARPQEPRFRLLGRSHAPKILLRRLDLTSIPDINLFQIAPTARPSG